MNTQILKTVLFILINPLISFSQIAIYQNANKTLELGLSNGIYYVKVLDKQWLGCSGCQEYASGGRYRITKNYILFIPDPFILGSSTNFELSYRDTSTAASVIEIKLPYDGGYCFRDSLLYLDVALVKDVNVTYLSAENINNLFRITIDKNLRLNRYDMLGLKFTISYPGNPFGEDHKYYIIIDPAELKYGKINTVYIHHSAWYPCSFLYPVAPSDSDYYEGRGSYQKGELYFFGMRFIKIR